MRSTLDRFLPYFWKISTFSLVDAISKELDRMIKTKRVFSFKKNNTVHDTGNKLYIGHYPRKIPILVSVSPETEKFLTHLLSQVNY